ncbi:MAG: hypothetical protein HYS86_03880 [Candidatus Chisholmbacteria bacterium]|nr:hypothetical protein [Candidatus Chisholmbacteria bacterium]
MHELGPGMVGIDVQGSIVVNDYIKEVAIPDSGPTRTRSHIEDEEDYIPSGLPKQVRTGRENTWIPETIQDLAQAAAEENRIILNQIAEKGSAGSGERLS